MSFIIISAVFIIVAITFDSAGSAPFVASAGESARLRQLEEAGIGTGIGIGTDAGLVTPDDGDDTGKAESASDIEVEVEGTTQREARAIGSSSGSNSARCFMTGCVPYSFTQESHGCGEGSIYRSQTKCRDGFIYECCPVTMHAPMALVVPNTQSNGLILSAGSRDHQHKFDYWSLYKMKKTAHKILCMMGQVNEVFC